MNIALALLKSHHRIIIAQEPSQSALLLYRQFPTVHGYSLDGAHDTARFEACVVLALAQAFEDPTYRIVFFVPRLLELEAIAQFKAIAKGMFDRLRVRRASMSKASVQEVHGLFKRALHQVMIGSEPTRAAPRHWVAYGFLEHDPRLPVWLREGLL